MTKHSPASFRPRLAASLACAAALFAGVATTHAAEPGTARPKVCLVLSGGGARGAAHIGVLRVLEELRVPVDCVVGTSMGAIVGAAYASGLSPERIATVVDEADWDALLSDQPPRAERSVYAKKLERERIGSAEVGVRRAELVLPQGVLVGHQLQFFLQSLVSTARAERFDALPIPYRAVATDFETGGMAVLDHGDLATAIRASMSVPGAFAPVERDGRILVDGGLVRNLPVDVARRLGADVVIAVNLGTPLLKRSELTSLLSAAEQTLNILTEQNVAASLAQLRPADVLVSPDLGDIAASDFTRSSEAIPLGENAARAVADRLRELSVGATEYARWRDRQRGDAAPRTIDAVRVDTGGLRFVTPASVDALVAGRTSPGQLERGINQLLATDDFQRIDARAETTPAGTTLVLRPLEKSWGPNYLRVGLTLAADLQGQSAFNVFLDHRATWLTPRGLEWRNRGSVGQANSLGTELRQPLDPGRRWFVAPRLELSQDQRNFYFDDEALATYRNRRSAFALNAGRRLGNYGEVSAGVELARIAETRTTGTPLFVDVRARTSALRLEAVVDRLDSLDFPQSGHLIRSTGRFARRVAGGDDEYDRVTFEWQQAFGSGPSSLLLALRHDDALGTSLPLYDSFMAGGFLNLSGYQREEILASRLTILRGIYRHRVGDRTSLLPGLYLGASLEGADVGERLNGTVAGRTLGGSLFLSAESVIGPFYVGMGYAEGGRAALYLYVGRP